MPVLQGNKPFSPAPLPAPESLASLKEDQVFYIPFTGEIFTTYLEYFDRILLYRKRCWSCCETMKSGLSYQQALESERKARLRAEPIFPSVWIKSALEIIHLNKTTLNDLIDEVYDYFRGTRFVTENVFVDVPAASGSDRSVERAVILEKLPNTIPTTLEKKIDKRQAAREAREAAEDNSRVPEDVHHYKIQLLATKTIYIVAPNQMRRPRQILSKITLKKYIKDVAKKDKWIGAPWIVKPSLVQKYGLVSEIPVDLNDPALKDKKGKPLKAVVSSLLDNPVEDSDLLLENGPYEKRKVEEEEGGEGTNSSAVELIPPTPFRGFGEVSNHMVLSLLRSFNFLQSYGRPLRLYPFQFDTFLRHLSHKNHSIPSEIISESFGSLLTIACHEYQSKADSQTTGNPYFNGFTNRDSNGDWSSVPTVNEAIGKVMEELKTFNALEKIAVDQWYKWRPGQWIGMGGKKKSSMDHIRAWPVALFGLIKDTMSDNGAKDVKKWTLLLKLLAPPHILSEEDRLASLNGKDDGEEKDDDSSMMAIDNSSDVDVEMDGTLEDDEIDQLPESEHESDGDYEAKNENASDDEEDELDWDGEDDTAAHNRGSIRGTSTRPILPSERVKPPPKQPAPKKASRPVPVKKEPVAPKVKAGPVMGFEDLCIRMEKSFWNFTADERVFLLTYIIDELLQDTRILSNYQNECIDKVTELRKEQREINRLRRVLTSSISELNKACKKLGGNTATTTAASASADAAPVEEAPEMPAIESDASDDEAHEGRPMRSARLSRSRKNQKNLFAVKLEEEELMDGKAPDAELTAEELLKMQEEKKELEAKDAQLMRRYDILDFEIRNCNGGVRLKLMGRDRYCNRYWYFDASNGSVSLDAITKTPLDPSVLEKPVGADPDIPYDYSTGVLFVEEFGVSSLTPQLRDEFSDLRLGLLDGSWGYLSSPNEFEQLYRWLDRRGIRESNLFRNLENYREYILDGMAKRQAILQEELQKSQDALSGRKSLRLSARNELMDEAFGYENWWQ